MSFDHGKIFFFALIISISGSLCAMNPQLAQTNPPPTNGTPHPRHPAIILPLHFITDAVNVQSQPRTFPAKRRRVDQTEEQKRTGDAVNAVFSSPTMLTNVLKCLGRSDFYRFGFVSKSCAKATQLPTAKEQLVAYMVSEQAIMPIQHVLSEANGEEFVNLYGSNFATKEIIKLLHEKGTLSDEPISDFHRRTILCEEDRQGIVVSQAVAQELSREELTALVPVKYLAIDYHTEFNADEIHEDATTEKQVIEQIANTVKEYPGHAIALELFLGNDALGKITESLINKLTEYPIISLHCDGQEFPHGLACLSALHQLRGLSITRCHILEDSTICDQLCKELPFLTVLQIVDSGLTSISSSIELQKHLVVLDVSDNEIIEFPQTLRNLRHLKILKLWQKCQLSAANVAQCLPTHGLRYLVLPTVEPNANPLSVSCDLQQLQILLLNDNIQQLLMHKNQLKNLKHITLEQNKSLAELPPCITELPYLESLSGYVPEATQVSYQTFLGIARQLQSCDLFTPIDSIGEIRKLANLWQLIQTNRELICSTMNTSNDETITTLLKPTITAKKLANLLAYPVSIIDQIKQLINETFAHHEIPTGLQEAAVVNKQFRPNDANFATTLNIIAWAMCHAIPVYSATTTNANEIPAQNPPLIENVLIPLQELAVTMESVMMTIDQRQIVTLAQFNKCIRQLWRCIPSDYPISNNCSLSLARLFLHHAVANYSVANAAMMLKFGAHVNSTFIDPFNTPLYVAQLTKEEAEKAGADELVKQEIEHMIYFLKNHGAH